MSLTRRSTFSLILFLALLICRVLQAEPETAKRLFTPADDVGLSTIEDRYEIGDRFAFSPDGRYFSVVTEQGVLERDVPEDTIWIFGTDKIRDFLHSSTREPPRPLPLVRMATDKDGPIIEHIRWLDDSTGVAFLAVQKSATTKFHQLFQADIKTGRVTAVTPPDQEVLGFDIKGQNCVYEVTTPEVLRSPLPEDLRTPLPVSNLHDLLFPPPAHVAPFHEAGMWALISGSRFQVHDAETGDAIEGTSALSLSPDGGYVATIMKVPTVPETWKSYKSPLGRGPYPLNPLAYHLVDLRSGRRMLLVNAPAGKGQHHSNTEGGWSTARWSADGHSLLLSNTFLPLDGVTDTERPLREQRPCTAVVRLPRREISCVLPVKAGSDKERYQITDLWFEDDHTVVIDFNRSYFRRQEPSSAVYTQAGDGAWTSVPNAQDPTELARNIRIEVHQGINESPVVTADDNGTRGSILIWDPNPQLQNIKLGDAEVVRWRDSSAFEWEAGLVKPPDFVQGHRYPLVIQTHGFLSSRFLSNGSYTTAFAARALAANGIVVLQMPENPKSFSTSNEGSDQIRGFESAVKKLTEDGIVDPAKVGVIGFSRTVYHVLEALTKGRVRFAAASITDGVTFGYFEDAFLVGATNADEYFRETHEINGGIPFSEDGLRNWLLNAPGFNMRKVTAPLLLLQPGKFAVFSGWEPYAALRSLNKPVDLIMLPSGTHVMTNPRQRLESETINVDWFRFWLKGEEDLDPAKREQYNRWRALRMLEQ